MKYAVVILVLLLITLGVMLFVMVPRVPQAELNAAILNIPPSLAQPSWRDAPVLHDAPDSVEQDNNEKLYVFANRQEIAQIERSGVVHVLPGHTEDEVVVALAKQVGYVTAQLAKADIAIGEMVEQPSKPCHHADDDNEPQNASY